MMLRREVTAFLVVVFSFVFRDAAASSEFPFSLGVRDSLMIAHSFHNNPRFGPAGSMHGATYTCDVEFLSKSLDPETNWVIDIGKASEIVSDVLVSAEPKNFLPQLCIRRCSVLISLTANLQKQYNLKNLDEVFPGGTMTTTEFMAKQIHDDIQSRLQVQCKEFIGCIRVKLWESHKAWGTYTGSMPK
jgi:6-pyruvoyltetrahydropterin/6-carboxytetrahydropterin synthase